MMKRIFFTILLLTAVINATTPTYENVTRLYVATFDRTPDVEGLKYWVNDSGLNLEEIARSFFDQPETKAKYYPDGTIYLDSFIDEVYLNLFDRVADSAGKEYWIDFILAGGFSRASVFILAVINGAQGDDITILASKTQAAYDAIKDQLTDEPDINIGACAPFSDTSYYWVTSGRLGLYCSYYSVDYAGGRLASETQYADDLAHGQSISYYETGDISAKGDYWLGYKIGTWVYPYREGTYDDIVAYCRVYDGEGGPSELISDCDVSF